MKVHLTILGEPASKANQRRLVKFGDRAAIVKSKKALEYERAAVVQIPPAARLMLEGPVRVTMTIFYASERPDLDESVVLDVMQAKFTPLKDGPRQLVRAGVYVNDRQVREKHIKHAIDRANPRAEIEVEQLHEVAMLFDQREAPLPIAEKRKLLHQAMVSMNASGKIIAEVAADVDPF